MRKQSKEELDKWYEKEDPWKYKSTCDDAQRLSEIRKYSRRIYEYLDRDVHRVLDIGCGEGFITDSLLHVFPDVAITGMDISQKALNRCSNEIIRLRADIYKDDLYWIGLYDVVLATGVLYGAKDKDIDKVISLVRPGGYLLLCHISEWEYNKGRFFNKLTCVDTKIFKYRQFHEEMFIFYKRKERRSNDFLIS